MNNYNLPREKRHKERLWPEAAGGGQSLLWRRAGLENSQYPLEDKYSGVLHLIALLRGQDDRDGFPRVCCNNCCSTNEEANVTLIWFLHKVTLIALYIMPACICHFCWK